MQLSFTLAVVVGFAQSTYTFSEDSGGVQVCVQLREGQLGTELSLQVHTHSGTAQGEYAYSVQDDTTGCLHLLDNEMAVIC